MAGTTAGSIATALLSVFLNKWDPGHNTIPAGETDPDAANTGYILGAGVLFSYFMCCPFFLLSAREYKKMLESIKADKDALEQAESRESSKIINASENVFNP